MCLTCPSQRETVHHLLMTCPAYTEERRQLESSIGRTSKSMKTLLTNPKTTLISLHKRHSPIQPRPYLNPPAQQEPPADRDSHPNSTSKQLRYPTRSA